MIGVSEEAMHPGPIRPKLARKPGESTPPSLGRRKRSKPYNVNDPLSRLYSWFEANGRTMDGVDPELLKKARIHVKARIDELVGLRRQASANDHRIHRIQTQLRWLKRWEQRIGEDP